MSKSLNKLVAQCLEANQISSYSHECRGDEDFLSNLGAWAAYEENDKISSPKSTDGSTKGPTQEGFQCYCRKDLNTVSA